MTAKETINWMKHKVYLRKWLLPLNLMQYGNPYAGHPFGNSSELTTSDHLLKRDIFHSLLMHSFFCRYILYGEETDEEEINM